MLTEVYKRMNEAKRRFTFYPDDFRTSDDIINDLWKANIKKVNTSSSYNEVTGSITKGKDTDELLQSIADKYDVELSLG